MRYELSRFMTGSSIIMIAQFQIYGYKKFEGKSYNINPITKKIIPVFFYDKQSFMPITFYEKNTCVKPLYINNMLITDIDHIWICDYLTDHTGNEFKNGDVFQIKGHIYSYYKKGNIMDFGFEPYSISEAYVP